MTEHLAGLYSRAAELAGRPVEVERLENGQYIVLWMAFGMSPPYSAKDEAGALEKFIGMMEVCQIANPVPELSDEELLEIRRGGDSEKSF
jgi:hypothetical protein